MKPIEFGYAGGRDDTINFKSGRIPPVPKDFVAYLIYPGGIRKDAGRVWRRRIWEWWHEARKAEIAENVLINMSNQLLGRRK